jgi:hypothetical protein
MTDDVPVFLCQIKLNSSKRRWRKKNLIFRSVFQRLAVDSKIFRFHLIILLYIAMKLFTFFKKIFNDGFDV